MISDDAIGELASRVIVTPEEFGRTFARAQSQRDVVEDLATVAATHHGVPEVEACMRYARDHGFAKRLLRKAVEAQVAGPILSPNGRTFAELCQVHAGVVASVDVAAAQSAVAELIGAAQQETDASSGQTVDRQALSADGYDAEVSFLSAQLQNTMRTVCRVVDARHGVSGSGVLIAPHLVATAAHVLDPLRDDTETGFKQDIAASLRVSLDTVAAHESGQDRSIPVADDWLVIDQRCTLKPGEDRRIVLPPAEELVDSHDVAIIRLSRAPGLTRGWANLEEAGYSVAERRPGLLLHHHPGGADQMVSYGARQGPHGSRFLHSCSSLPGSSGGPLISPGARLVGIHHGSISDADPARNLAGGGDWLARWWRDHPQDHVPDPSLNPLWELLLAGPVGRGTPLIGFDGLQQEVWKAQLGSEPLAAVATMASSPGRLLPTLISLMLPAGAAGILMLRRPELDRIAGEAIDAPEPVTAVLDGLARQLRLPPRPAPQISASELSTDSVRAAAMAGVLAERINQVQNAGPIWLLVHVEDKPLLTAVSEALGYLYRAVLSLEGGRGRLLVIGEVPGLHGAVTEMLRDMLVGSVRHWQPEPPDESGLKRYLARWCRAVLRDRPDLHDRIVFAARFFLRIAELETVPGGDLYASLQNTLAVELDNMVRSPV